ncbi:GHKL domain-containing protein [Flavobacterium sp. Sd200]|nr:GHKL domain-containing protein [Flavobacterium sp. Sd200]
MFYDKTISAILNNDFTADFTVHSSFENYRNLIKLYTTLKTNQHDQVTQDLVYRSILNNIETAVVILREDDNEWGIFFSNDYFSKYFDVPHISKWKYLKKHLPALCDVVEQHNFQDMRTSLQVRMDNGDNQTFMFQTSRTSAFGKVYYMILLDSIQNIVAKKEKDAWINLMKVISHELMNSITPIRSLSQNLSELMHQKELSNEDMHDIRQSVDTMIQRSNHLQSFIDSYRKLAMLPSPDKKPVLLNTLVNSVLQLMKPSFESEYIVTENNIPSGITIMADVLQLEQVFINLLTNSINALKSSENKKILIETNANPDRIFITITDTGQGIDKEIEDKIFLPFFTTRKNGAGIGLTLSKNIIEAHGGYLNYQMHDGKTSFTISILR